MAADELGDLECGEQPTRQVAVRCWRLRGWLLIDLTLKGPVLLAPLHGFLRTKQVDCEWRGGGRCGMFGTDRARVVRRSVVRGYPERDAWLGG